MADKQFYEFKLEADTTTQSGSLPFINDLFVDIVNYDEVMPYYYNSGYRENLDHVPGEKSQRAKFGLIKMQGYQKIKLYRWANPTNINNPGELIVDNTQYEITDAIFVDGVRYLMAVYDNYTKMKIFKQINVNEIETCANSTYESGLVGNFVDISKYVYKSDGGTEHTIYHYPFNKCCDPKFTVAAWGKGKKKQSGDLGFMKVELTGDHIFYYFYDSSAPINAGAGDFLYINEGGLSGQIVPLAGNTTIDGFQGVETVFAWTGVNLDEGSSEGISTQHSWVLYEDYGDIINFVCADGLIHLNYSNAIPAETEITICGSMYSNTINLTYQPNFIISSMINFRPLDSIALYDVIDGDIKYGLSGFLKFYFKASNQFYISKDFTDLVEFQDYIVMMGPGKTGIAYPYITNTDSGVVRNFYRQIGDGYVNRGSRVSDGTNLLMANDKGIRALNLQANGYGDSTRFPISAEWTFQPGPFIADLSQFNRDLGETIGMSLVNKQFLIFIRTPEGTMIWIKSIEHNYRRQHILYDGEGINGFKAGVYLGNGAYGRGGDANVKTYLSFFFGDKTILTPKNLLDLKLAFGRDSWITKGNTILQVSYTLSGRTYTVNYEDRDTSVWIQDLMRLKLTGNTDNVFETYENEISMHSGEGHGKYLSKSLYNVNKIKSFRDFNPVELMPVGGIDTADFNDQYTLSNRSTVHMSLGYMADVVSFKLITKGRDSVEFYGAQLWYELTNESGGSLDNSIVEKVSADDGSSPNG